MQAFYIGLLGALTGGLLLSGTVALLFFYEKRERNQEADKLINDIKTMYTEKFNAKTNKIPTDIKFN